MNNLSKVTLIILQAPILSVIRKTIKCIFGFLKFVFEFAAKHQVLLATKMWKSTTENIAYYEAFLVWENVFFAVDVC